MVMPLFDSLPARGTDPVTSHEAGVIARRGARELEAAIRWWVERQPEPVSAFDIARALSGYRWSSATVRSAVSRANLHAVDTLGTTDRNRRCLRYRLSR